MNDFRFRGKKNGMRALVYGGVGGDFLFKGPVFLILSSILLSSISSEFLPSLSPSRQLKEPMFLMMMGKRVEEGVWMMGEGNGKEGRVCG